jgi:hypothetical protein
MLVEREKFNAESQVRALAQECLALDIGRKAKDQRL